MSNNMLSLMDEFFNDTFYPVNQALGRSRTAPALNVTEYPDKYQISLAIPGIPADQVNIEFDDGVLTMSYDHETKDEDKTDEGQLIRQEYAHYSFSRSVSLPKNIDPENIEAHAESGILNVTVAKLPQSQPRKIDVKLRG
jgi:HSP20 family protein